MGEQQRRDLHARLRGLRERAEAARREAGKSCSQTAVASRIQGFSGQRISDWAPEEFARFKVPQVASDDQVLALVTLWADWAGEEVGAAGWRAALERARDEQADERPRSPVAAPGLTVEQAGPSLLEVHHAVEPAPSSGAHPWLTSYVPRAHDTELRHALAPALDGRTSVLAMLTGGSSTGKTRALYEALNDLAGSRPLLRPATTADLLALLEDGTVTSGVVLWLNETQRVLYGPEGELAAARLRAVLERQAGVVAVGTMWERPHWEAFVATGVPGEPHGQARALLTGGITRRIRVPESLSPEDRKRWEDFAWNHSDRRLRYALRAGATDGRVVQHLSGGPELLEAYLEGPGATFTHGEHALITAALDARHLGHHAPIPAALLAQAADGALSPVHRSADPGWAKHALHWLATGARADGTRTDIRRTLAPLVAFRACAGAPAHYRPADYLDQHARTPLEEELGDPALWDALIAHTTEPEDLHRLFDEAWRRGLFKHAVQLGRRAVLAGHRTAQGALVHRVAGPLDPLGHGARWVAEHCDMADADAVTRLLMTLHRVGPREVLEAFADRAAAHVDLGDPESVDDVLRWLRQVDAWSAARALADRAVAHIDPTSPHAVHDLLNALRGGDLKEAEQALAGRVVAHADLVADATDLGRLATRFSFTGLENAVDVLFERAVSRVDVSDPEALVHLLGSLRHGGRQHVARLAGRIEAHADLIDPRRMARLMWKLCVMGAQETARKLLSRDPAAHIDLTDTHAVHDLLRALQAVRAEQALLDRDPAAHVDVRDVYEVRWLWRSLQESHAVDAVETLARRTVGQVDLNDPDAVNELLRELRDMGLDGPLAMLLERDPASQVDLIRSEEFNPTQELLETLRELGAQQAVDALEHRLATDVDLTDPDDTGLVVDMLNEAGADSAIGVLADRAATLPAPEVCHVLLELASAAVGQDVDNLAVHIASHSDLSDPRVVNQLWRTLREAGAQRAVELLLARDPVSHIDLTHQVSYETSVSLIELLTTLKDARLRQAAAALARRAAAHCDIDNPFLVAGLLETVGETGTESDTELLARRAAEAADLTVPYGIVPLLQSMRQCGAEQAVQLLVGRVAAGYTDIPVGFLAGDGAGPLMEMLREAGADEAFDALARRAAEAGLGPIHPPLPYGRDLDGHPSAPWTWDNIPTP